MRSAICSEAHSTCSVAASTAEYVHPRHLLEPRQKTVPPLRKTCDWHRKSRRRLPRPPSHRSTCRNPMIGPRGPACMHQNCAYNHTLYRFMLRVFSHTRTQQQQRNTATQPRSGQHDTIKRCSIASCNQNQIFVYPIERTASGFLPPGQNHRPCARQGNANESNETIKTTRRHKGSKNQKHVQRMTASGVH